MKVLQIDADVSMIANSALVSTRHISWPKRLL